MKGPHPDSREVREPGEVLEEHGGREEERGRHLFRVIYLVRSTCHAISGHGLVDHPQHAAATWLDEIVRYDCRVRIDSRGMVGVPHRPLLPQLPTPAAARHPPASSAS